MIALTLPVGLPTPRKVQNQKHNFLRSRCVEQQNANLQNLFFFRFRTHVLNNYVALQKLIRKLKRPTCSKVCRKRPHQGGQVNGATL